MAWFSGSQPVRLIPCSAKDFTRAHHGVFFVGLGLPTLNEQYYGPSCL